MQFIYLAKTANIIMHWWCDVTPTVTLQSYKLHNTATAPWLVLISHSTEDRRL